MTSKRLAIHNHWSPQTKNYSIVYGGFLTFLSLSGKTNNYYYKE